MFKRSEAVEQLAKVPLFAYCKPRELQRIARDLDIADVPADHTVVSEGDAGDAFFMILEGAAKVVRNRRTIAKLGPGDHFGELALLDPAPRNATVVTTEAAKLGVLEGKVFQRALTEVPTLAPRLLGALAVRAREDLKDASG